MGLTGSIAVGAGLQASPQWYFEYEAEKCLHKKCLRSAQEHSLELRPSTTLVRDIVPLSVSGVGFLGWAKHR